MKIREKRGITLIALIVTIIILLILAGISIVMLTGENGILSRTVEASQKTNLEGIKEQVELARQNLIIENGVKGKNTTREEIIQEIIDQLGGKATGNLITTEDEKYEIMVKEDNTIEVVEKGQGYVDAEYKDPEPEELFDWTLLEDGTVRILRYNGNEVSLKIPDTIEGKTVTVLWNDKLAGGAVGSAGSITYYGGNIATNVKLKSISIPDTVKKIGHTAFSNNEINHVKLSANLLEIDRQAFSNNKITTLDIPESLTTIGDLAFSNNSITKLNIPEGVTTIGNNAFSNNSIETIHIAKTVSTIGSQAFANNKIKQLEIPTGVTEIGIRAFCNNQIASLNISKTVTKLGGGAFAQNNMEKIIYGRTETGEEDSTVINSYAGRNAGNVTIPGTVKRIEQYAFENVGIKSVVIEEGLTSIGTSAFVGENIDKLIIPATLNTEINYRY